MDICGSSEVATNKSNNLTIQVNDHGQQDVVSQPSGTVIVNCYKDATNAIESESAVCIKVLDKEGVKSNINVHSAKKSRSTQCDEDHEPSDQLFANDKEISACCAAKVNDRSSFSANVQNEKAIRDESEIMPMVNKKKKNNSAHTNVIIENDNGSCSDLNHSSSSTSSETDIFKDNSLTSSRPQPKSFKSTEAQTDNNFLQPNQKTTVSEAVAETISAAMPVQQAEPLTGSNNPVPCASGQSREERRRERRERRQNRALNQAGRHCHPNQSRASGGGGGGHGTVPPYEILPDLVNNHHHIYHILPPPYSTLPSGSTMVGSGAGRPLPIVPRLPPPGHHHMALQRLRSASPPPAPMLMQPPPTVPILQPVPVASIASAVGEDPRFLFQLPVIRR